MNKKIFAGLLSVAAVSSFWACGSGEISSFDDNDSFFQMQFASETEAVRSNFVELYRKECQNDPICNAEHPGFATGAVPASSSAAQQVVTSSNSNQKVNSSSSVAPIVIASATSSSAQTIPVVVSSSSAAAEVPASGLGSCAPTKASINKGESTTFKFTQNPADISGFDAMTFATQADYDWTYADGIESGSKSMVTSATATFNNPGTKYATVKVSIGGKTETIKCSPLQVLGTPIDNCSCTASLETADIADPQTSTVTWTVSNCTSIGADITGYTWPAGFVSEGNKGSFTFTTKDQSVTPEVTVTNNDSTATVVNTCPAVVAIDGNNPETVTPSDKSTIYEGPRKYTFASCNNKTGSMDIQVSSNKANCASLITSETTLASTVGYWNNAEGSCTFGAKASFPLTIDLPEGATFQFTGGCY